MNRHPVHNGDGCSLGRLLLVDSILGTLLTWLPAMAFLSPDKANDESMPYPDRQPGGKACAWYGATGLTYSERLEPFTVNRSLGTALQYWSGVDD